MVLLSSARGAMGSGPTNWQKMAGLIHMSSNLDIFIWVEPPRNQSVQVVPLFIVRRSCCVRIQSRSMAPVSASSATVTARLAKELCWAAASSLAQRTLQMAPKVLTRSLFHALCKGAGGGRSGQAAGSSARIFFFF